MKLCFIFIFVFINKNSMNDLLEKNSPASKKPAPKIELLVKPPRVGEIVEGKIIGLKKGAVYVDLGPVGTGIIFGKEFLEAKEILRGLKSGDAVFAKVVDLENDDGYIELSLSKAGQELNWDKLKQLKDGGELVKVNILGANKGGLLAEVLGIQGFLPVSQLSPQNYPRVEGGDASKILRELQKFVGKEFDVKIFDIEPKEGKLILSEKAKETERLKEILKNYKVGDIVGGEITGLVDFGAFIKFGEELEGLIHISELDWAIVENPSDFVKIGDKVKAKIIEIKDDRVSLSLKALKEDPWANVEEKYKKGDKVSGKITKFNPFGAFVQINPKIQGLCHISEFITRAKMEEKLKLEEAYDFQILSIEPKEHRMSLKLVEKPAE